MSLQWTLVAGFLYVEIAVVILLLLPIIPPKTWQKFFKSRFLKSLESQSNLYFSGFLIILVLLFIDSIREMRRYTATREMDHEHGHLNAEMQHSMKLFRAQRNFYIAGFALFLCLVVRRLTSLISRQAVALAEKEAALKQAESASLTASSLLKEKSSTGGDSHVTDNEGNRRIEKSETNVRQLREELADTKEELMRTKIQMEAMKKQAESVSTEYDRLMKEHEKLQKEVGCDNKKDH